MIDFYYDPNGVLGGLIKDMENKAKKLCNNNKPVIKNFSNIAEFFFNIGQYYEAHQTRNGFFPESKKPKDFTVELTEKETILIKAIRFPIELEINYNKHSAFQLTFQGEEGQNLKQRFKEFVEPPCHFGGLFIHDIINPEVLFNEKCNKAKKSRIYSIVHLVDIFVGNLEYERKNSKGENNDGTSN